MKKEIISIAFILIALFSFGQTKQYYKIIGNVRDTNTLQRLEGCYVKLVSSTGIAIEVKTNKKGDFSFDSLSLGNKAVNLEVTKKGYLTNSKNKKSIIFNSTPHDTIINFKITPVPGCSMFTPEIYFKYNSVKPTNKNMDGFIDMLMTMQANEHLVIEIIGFKDSIETVDMRYLRAEFVCNELVKKGINKGRLKIKISDKPNFGKYIEPSLNLETGENTYHDITESFILNAPIEKQESLRQLNRCVSFSIISDDFDRENTK